MSTVFVFGSGYHYQALKDHVTAEEFARHIATIKKADENIAYSFSQSFVDETAGGTATGILSQHYTSIYLLLGLCVLITYMLKKSR